MGNFYWPPTNGPETGPWTFSWESLVALGLALFTAGLALSTRALARETAADERAGRVFEDWLPRGARFSCPSHVNRIKMLKRQMFGRADFSVLRKRVLLAR